MGTALRRSPAPQPELYRFSALDYTTVGLYAAVAVLFAVAGSLLQPLLLQLSPDPTIAVYSVNLLFYGGVGVLAVAAARHVVSRDLRVLATRPWFTLLMVPLAVVAMLILTAILVALTGPVQNSANQVNVQALVQHVPPWLIVPLLVIVGPFVEEYIFRHLLIGKLSRRINIWVCCVVSAALFAVLHIVGQETLTLQVLMPYLAMGAVLVFVYVWAGRNVMFSYFVHASKNLLAVIFIYAIPPDVLEQLQQLQG
jgi:membrane protease YdiL (CAAX protease family)